MEDVAIHFIALDVELSQAASLMHRFVKAKGNHVPERVRLAGAFFLIYHCVKISSMVYIHILGSVMLDTRYTLGVFAMSSRPCWVLHTHYFTPQFCEETTKDRLDQTVLYEASSLVQQQWGQHAEDGGLGKNRKSYIRPWNKRRKTMIRQGTMGHETGNSTDYFESLHAHLILIYSIYHSNQRVLPSYEQRKCVGVFSFILLAPIVVMFELSGRARTTVVQVFISSSSSVSLATLRSF